MDEDYAFELTKRAIARACLALGFKQCEKEAMDALADVVHNYIRTIGVNLRDHAEQCGRPFVGTQDVLDILERTVSRVSYSSVTYSSTCSQVKNVKIFIINIILNHSGRSRSVGATWSLLRSKIRTHPSPPLEGNGRSRSHSMFPLSQSTRRRT